MKSIQPVQLENIDQFYEAIDLTLYIKGNGTAEFSSYFYAYGNVNSFNINFHIPKYEPGVYPFLEMKIGLENGDRESNDKVLTTLKYYVDNGFDNDPVVISNRNEQRAAKVELLSKLQLELKETV